MEETIHLTGEERYEAISDRAYDMADRIRGIIRDLGAMVTDAQREAVAIEDDGFRRDAFEILNGLILTKGAVEHAYDVITLLAAY